MKDCLGCREVSRRQLGPVQLPRGISESSIRLEVNVGTSHKAESVSVIEGKARCDSARRFREFTIAGSLPAEAGYVGVDTSFSMGTTGCASCISQGAMEGSKR